MCRAAVAASAAISASSSSVAQGCRVCAAAVSSGAARASKGAGLRAVCTALTTDRQSLSPKISPIAAALEHFVNHPATVPASFAALLHTTEPVPATMQASVPLGAARKAAT